MKTPCNPSNAVLLSNQAFSNGRGSEIVCFTLDIFAKRVMGRTMGDLTRDMGTTWRHMVNDSQYRWIGPEKSVTHLAVAGVLNAVWDLWGKILAKPVWRIVADMTPEELVKCVDFRYITDAITPEEALKLLKTTQIGKEDRIAEALKNEAVPVRFFFFFFFFGQKYGPKLLTVTFLGLFDIGGLACVLR
jgi:L-galactonate dehydratase